MSYYLKYRPRTIAELDLDKVRENLEKIAESGNIPKSMLFVGPRGGGKTSSARIIAKLVNCLKEGDKPCLKCESCTSIEYGSAIDVMEMDAASNRGIDAIRELRDKINLTPVSAKMKVYIIDEVHMLTTEAFNALLKTLEEPPAHVMFLLCTTEEHKVPETILSRCTKVAFYKASNAEVRRSLDKAVKGEKLVISDEALELLSESVDGSFREGHKLLEVLAGITKKIGIDEVRQVLGQSGGAKVEVLAKLLVEGKVKESLDEIEQVVNLGVDILSYTKQLLEHLRMLLKNDYRNQRVLEVVRKVGSAAIEMKVAVIEQLPLELVAVELGEEGSSPNIKTQKSPVLNQPIPEAKQPIESKEVPQVKVVEKTDDPGGEDTIHAPRIGRTDVSLGEVLEKWEEMLKVLAPKNHSVAGLLRAAKPKAVEGGLLIVEVFYKFHKEQLEQEAKRRLLEDALNDMVGLNSVRLVLGEKAQRAVETMPEHDNISLVAEDTVLAQAAEDVFGV